MGIKKIYLSKYSKVNQVESKDYLLIKVGKLPRNHSTII